MRKCRKCCKKYSKEVLVCPNCGQNLKYPEGKKFAIITLILMTVPFALGIMAIYCPEFFYAIGFGPYITTTYIGIPSMVAAFIMSIVGHAKYPGNVFCTVLFWITISATVGIFINYIIKIIICAEMIKSCPDIIDSCG